MNLLNTRYRNSLQLWEQSKKRVIPGSSTISKRADLYPLGAYPIYLNRAQGSEVWDVDNNRYVDFQSALGAVLLGFNHPSVNASMRTQLELGSLFSLSHPSLLHLAEKIIQHIPCAERVRILKNGSDATTGAVRIARAYTGREKILCCHYHGWHDWYYVSTSLNAGIPSALKEKIIPFPYNDLEAFQNILAEHQGEIAAVIMEPTYLHPPAPGYLEHIKQETQKAGALLIFDEVVTGFRFGLGGAQSYFGVVPDLACFAKALGNSAPIAVIAGTEKIMEATAHVVTTQTYGEDCLATASALACINILETEPVLETIWEMGALFQQGYHELARTYNIATQCVGYPVRMQIEFADRDNLSSQFLKSYLLQETAKDGFLLAHMIFINYAHTKEQILQVLHSIERVFQQLGNNQIRPESLVGNLALNLW